MLGQRCVGPDAWVRDTIASDAPETEQMCQSLTKQKGLAPGNVPHLTHSLSSMSLSHAGLTSGSAWPGQRLPPLWLY